MAGVFCDGPGGRACFLRRLAMFFASVGCVFCLGGVFCDHNPCFSRRFLLLCGSSGFITILHHHVSNEKSPDCLGYMGDCTNYPVMSGLFFLSHFFGCRNLKQPGPDPWKTRGPSTPGVHKESFKCHLVVKLPPVLKPFSG